MDDLLNEFEKHLTDFTYNSGDDSDVDLDIASEELFANFNARRSMGRMSLSILQQQPNFCGFMSSLSPKLNSSQNGFKYSLNIKNLSKMNEEEVMAYIEKLENDNEVNRRNCIAEIVKDLEKKLTKQHQQIKQKIDNMEINFQERLKLIKTDLLTTACESYSQMINPKIEDINKTKSILSKLVQKYNDCKTIFEESVEVDQSSSNLFPKHK